jgi:uncharacterized protein (TIGR02271 family)
VNQSADAVAHAVEQPETGPAKSSSGPKTFVGTSEFVVPVLREDLDVRKEVFRTGTVRLRKLVHEAPETVSELLASENVEIERVSMDVIIDTPPPVRIEGDVTVIPIVEEVLVFTKQLRLKEELRITKRRSVSDFRQEVSLRSEELIVERLDNE